MFICDDPTSALTVACRSPEMRSYDVSVPLSERGARTLVVVGRHRSTGPLGAVRQSILEERVVESGPVVVRRVDAPPSATTSWIVQVLERPEPRLYVED